MDKETLSNYGWVVITVLVLAIMIALATPFGTYISDGVKSTTEGLFKSSKNALDVGLEEAGITITDQEFEDVNTVGGGVSTENLNHSGIIPEGGTYFSQPDICTNCIDNYEGSFCGAIGETCSNCGYAFTKGTRYSAGNEFPAPQKGDKYQYGDYEYCYGYEWHEDSCWGIDDGCTGFATDGWGVSLINDIEKPGAILENIGDIKITSLVFAFDGRQNIIYAPSVPSGVTDMSCAFSCCTNLLYPPDLSKANSLITMENAFCATGMVDASSMVIPSNVINISSLFCESYSLTKAPDLSKATNLENVSGAFHYCESLTGTIELNANPTEYDIFISYTQISNITGTTTLVDELMATKYQ